MESKDKIIEEFCQTEEKDIIGHYNRHVDISLHIPNKWEKRIAKEQQKAREKYEKEFTEVQWQNFYKKLYRKSVIDVLEFVFKTVIKLMLANDKTHLPPIDNTPPWLRPLD